MKTRFHSSTVGLGVLALTAAISIPVVGNSYAEPERSSVKATEAVIVEFRFVPKSGADARLAKLATLSVSRELNRGVKAFSSSSADKNTDRETKSLYRIAGDTLPAAPKSRQSDLVPSSIRKAAHSQNADAVVTGWITDVKFVGDGSVEHPRRAKVTLSVQVIGVITEEMENGAIAAGYSALPTENARLSDEEMLSQAISEAAGKIALYLQTYRTPRASVVSCTGKEVILDSGKQDGMMLGTELAVIRDRKVTARIRVTKMDDHKAWAAVLSDSDDVQTGDEARGLFRLPS